MEGNPGWERLIPLVNKLQDVFNSIGQQSSLSLPQIAVVGGQSSGKSSVLELIVGRSFLPRGTGIVTRRPLVLQLIHNNSEWAEFLHSKSKKFFDFDDVRKEIEAETNRVTGHKKGISNLPINLRIYSPNVLNLTLIDLPGVTKIPIGDQPADIEEQIRNMIFKYVKHENCLILAVTPANSDIANSEALKIAKEVDPQGVRTIGVITKLDIMDKGTDAREILENKVFPLKRGYVGVVNRSQKDIDAGIDMANALAAERKFFSSHPAYKHLGDRTGTMYLQKVLNRELTNHIRESLPILRETLLKHVNAMDKEVEMFKNVNVNDTAFATKMMIQSIQRLQVDFERTIEGSHAAAVSTISLSCGAKINRIFHERFHFEIVKLEFDEKKLRKEIAIAIKNIHAVRVGVFPPDMAFEAIVKKWIIKLEEPCTKCVELVTAELCNAIRECTSQLTRFPRFKNTLESFVENHVCFRQQICNAEILGFIKSQMAYINTNHDDFIGISLSTTNQIPEVVSKRPVRRLGNQVIRKGWMSINSRGPISWTGSRDWFVLTAESLTWYKDEDEKDRKYMILLDGIKMRDVIQGLVNRRAVFALFHSEKKNVYRDNLQLELICDSFEEMESWKASFLRAGVYPEIVENTTDDEKDVTNEGGHSIDPHLERQVEMIKNLVYSYLKIVGKTFRDFIPKMITFLIINDVKNFINTDLLTKFHDIKDQCALMEESEEDRLKREQLIKAYNACKEALDTINKMSINSNFQESRHLSNSDWKTTVTSSLNTALQNRVINRAAPPLPPNKPALYQNRTRSNNLPVNGVNGKMQR